jgi:hypothetical protein
MKKCTKCGKEKENDCFGKHGRTKDGLQFWCNSCRREYRIGNDTNIDSYMKVWRNLHPHYARDWARKHPQTSKPRKINSEASKAKELKRVNQPLGRINKNLGAAISRSLQRGTRLGRTRESVVGYTLLQLKEHLEARFKRGMTWGNYGEWHIDHIIPIAAFNFTTPDCIDFKRCWSLENLQPLWKIENAIKSNKLDRPFQPSLL